MKVTIQNVPPVALAVQPPAPIVMRMSVQQGAPGRPGKTIWPTDGAPDAALGELGDLCFDKAAIAIYGPKDDAGWGEPVSLVGVPGAVEWLSVLNRPIVFPPAAHEHDYDPTGTAAAAVGAHAGAAGAHSIAGVTGLLAALAERPTAAEADARWEAFLGGVTPAEMDTFYEAVAAIQDEGNAISALTLLIAGKEAIGVAATLDAEHVAHADPHPVYPLITSLGQRIRDAVLTGISFASSAAVTAADSVLVMAGKLQSQITALIGGTLAGDFFLRNPSESVQDLGNISGSITLSLANGCNFKGTITGAATITMPATPTSGSKSISLRLTNGGSAAVTFRNPDNVTPPITEGGTAITLTTAGRDDLVLDAMAGDTKWAMSLARKDVK